MTKERTERDLNKTHKRYEQQCYAWVGKVSTALVVERDLDGGKCLCRYDKPRFPDFKGEMLDGRAVAIEAKEITDKPKRKGAPLKRLVSFPLSEIKPHQMTYIKRVARLGGVGGVYIRRVEKGVATDFYIPADKIDQLANGAKSIKYTAMAGYEVPRNGWLDCLPELPLDDQIGAIERYLLGPCTAKQTLTLEKRLGALYERRKMDG